MSIKRDVSSIKRRLGWQKRRPLFAAACGYNAADEILYDIDGGLTEPEIRAKYPKDEFDIHLVVIGVSDGEGNSAVDEKGRAQIVDVRGL